MISLAKGKGRCSRTSKMADAWLTLAFIAAVLPSIQASLWPQTDCCPYDVIFYVDLLGMSEFEFSEMRETLMLVSNSIEMNSGRGTRLGLLLIPPATGEIPLTGDIAEFQLGLNNLFYIPQSPRDVAAAITIVSRMYDRALWRPNIRKVAIGILNGISNDPGATALAAHHARMNYIYMGVIGVTSQPVDADFNTELLAIASVPESKYMHTVDSYVSLRFLREMEVFYSEILMQSGVCCDCQWTNYLHFYPDPADPNAYLRCYQPHRFLRQYCPLGLFWDQTQSSCVPAWQLLVKDDPCRWYTDWQVYADGKVGRNCRVFWICSPGIQTIFTDCCPAFTRFNRDSKEFDCIPDLTCDDDCPPISPSDPVSPTLLPPGPTPVTPQPIPACDPEIHIDFLNGVMDARGIYVENHGVDVLTGADVPSGASVKDGGQRAVGFFDGNAFLVIPRFAFGWYGSFVTYQIRYRPILPVTEEELATEREDILVTNGDCGVDETLLATYLPNQHQVSTTEKGSVTPEKTLTVPAEFSGGLGDWLTVTVTLELSNLGIDSRDQSTAGSHFGNAPFYGYILQTKPALHIGGYTESSLNQYVNFHGYIDEFYLWFCPRFV